MKRWFVFLVLICICLFTFTACKKKDTKPKVETEIENEEKKYKFGFSCLEIEGNEYYEVLEKSLRDNVEAAGHTLVTKDAKKDITLQSQQIDEFIAEGIDVVFLIPVDLVAIEPALDRLNEAGIIVVNVDSQVEAIDKVNAFVGSNNFRAGEACGKDMLERIPAGGKIILVECRSLNSFNERIRGFERAIAKKFEVVARIESNAEYESAVANVGTVLQEHPDVVAIMCGNDTTAMGAVAAAESLGRTDVIVYGIDGSPIAKNEIAREGSILVGTAAQSTGMMGQQSVEIALNLLNGEKCSKKNYTDFNLITKENIPEYELNTWQ